MSILKEFLSLFKRTKANEIIEDEYGNELNNDGSRSDGLTESPLCKDWDHEGIRDVINRSVASRMKEDPEFSIGSDAECLEEFISQLEDDLAHSRAKFEAETLVSEGLRTQLENYKVSAEAKLESTRKLLRLHANELKRIRPVKEAAVAFIDKKKESPSFLALRREGKPLPELVRKLQMFDSEEAANLIEAVEEMQNGRSELQDP